MWTNFTFYYVEYEEDKENITDYKGKMGQGKKIRIKAMNIKL